jgi:hypothetical protein
MNGPEINVPPNDHSVPCSLSHDGFSANLLVSREIVFKGQPNHMIGVAIGFDEEFQKRMEFPPYMVFQLRVTDHGGLEQVGEGFPCQNTVYADHLLEIIKSKNLKVPVVMLICWPGNFALVTMECLNAKHEQLVLFNYKEVQTQGNISSKFSIQHYLLSLGKPREMIREEFLPTIDPEIAQKLFREKSDELKQIALKEQSKPVKSPIPEHEIKQLNESQLIVLARAFPQTVKIFQEKSTSDAEIIYAAFKRDLSAITGKIDGTVTLNQQQFDDLRNRLTNKKKNKKKIIDPVEYELVGGWFFKRYAYMTPEQRKTELDKLGLEAPTPNGIRKICKKLKLPSVRKPGRNK